SVAPPVRLQPCGARSPCRALQPTGTGYIEHPTRSDVNGASLVNQLDDDAAAGNKTPSHESALERFTLWVNLSNWNPRMRATRPRLTAQTAAGYHRSAAWLVRPPVRKAADAVPAVPAREPSQRPLLQWLRREAGGALPAVQPGESC